MKPLASAVVIAMGVVAASAAEDTSRILIPPDCVWIELSASDASLRTGGAGAIFAKHGELGRVEDLRTSIIEPTIFDESRPSQISSAAVGTVRVNGPRLPFSRFERFFASGATTRPVSIHSVPAELLVKRASDGSIQALWVERETRFPLRFVVMRGRSFEWSEFYPVYASRASSDHVAAGSQPGLRTLYADEIQQARRSFEALIAELPWKGELEQVN